MSIKKYKDYHSAERDLINHILDKPDFVTATTFEVINTGFILTEPENNLNNHSNYEYAEKFFEWMMSGEKELSPDLIKINPWVKRFVDSAGLPEGFSSSYGFKLYCQMPTLLYELKNKKESRRAYFNILFPDDHIILQSKTTHEYPCTIGLHMMVRDEILHMIVNMRSNNVWAVMPYDVYNFTNFQIDVAKALKVGIGHYHHQINNAHLYKGDARRLREARLKPDLS